MPYLLKTWKFKNSIEIEKVFSGRYGRHGYHIKKEKPTKEEVEKINERNAVNKLRRLIKFNFCEDDWHLVLTYKKNERPMPEEAREILKKFIRSMRTAYKKAGYELKYIHVTEYHNKAIHHHMVINNMPEITNLVKKYWTCGRPNFSPLLEEYTYGDLAEYLLKETKKTYKNTPMQEKVYTKSELSYTCAQNRSRKSKDILKRTQTDKRILHR